MGVITSGRLTTWILDHTHLLHPKLVATGHLFRHVGTFRGRCTKFTGLGAAKQSPTSSAVLLSSLSDAGCRLLTNCKPI